MTDIRDRIFKAIYDNCMLPENRCREIADQVYAALNADEGTTTE